MRNCQPRLLGLVALLGVGPSACCLPVPTSATVVPALDVTVTNQERPIAGAAVTVARYPYGPHFMPEEGRLHTVATGADGRVVFDRQAESETVYPLMMHGVPGYGFQVCVEAVGHRTIVHGIDEPVEGEVAKLKVALEQGDSDPCSTLLGQKRLGAGESHTAGTAAP